MKKLLVFLLPVILLVGCGDSVVSESSLVIEDSSVEKKQTDVGEDTQSLVCDLYAETKSISCEASFYPNDATLKWSSDATSRTMQGSSKFDFQIETFLSLSTITLDICIGSDCETVNSILDTSAILSRQKNSDAETSSGQGNSRNSSENKSGSDRNEDRDLFFDQYQCSGTTATEFSMFYPIELIDEIIPMGKLNAGSGHVTPTDHLYIHRDQSAIERDSQHYITAPSPGYIVQITRQREDQRLFGDTNASGRSSPLVPDHRLIILHSCSFMTIFIHLGELAPGIVDAIGILGPGDRWNAQSQSDAIYLKTSDPIARFGDDNLDWSVHDANVELPGLIATERYEEAEPWKIHTVDPFQFFVSSEREALLTKVKRTATPRSGKIDYDIENRIVGNWYLKGTSYRGIVTEGEDGYWSGHLAIAYDHIDPTRITLSTGKKLGIDQQIHQRNWGVFQLEGPDPDSIGPTDGPVRYEMYTQNSDNFLGIVLIQHLGDRSIEIEVFSNDFSEEVLDFSSDSKIYIR